MGRYSVKRYKTKRRARDLDLIFNDLSNAESVEALKHQPLDETKPGLGQYYCIHCAKYFETRVALAGHLKTKIHKRRVKDLKARPYTQVESDAAAGTDVVKFMDRVEHYKKKDQERLVIEGQKLGDVQIEELRVKDAANEARFAGEALDDKSNENVEMA